MNQITSPWKSLLLIALIATTLNAFKPLHMDDTAYYYFAKHIAEKPLDPYGGEVFWYQWPEPSMAILCPPVLPYWWAVGIRLFGDNVFLWKMWLLPFLVIFVFSLHALFRRFARGMEMPLVWLTALSPTFLPSINLMLDVPAMALSLLAITTFMRAVDRASWRLALLAGFIAALAIQTKYTGLTVLAAMGLYAFLFRQLRLGAVAVSVGLLLFGAWEAWIAHEYGISHFIYHCLRNARSLSRIELAPQLFAVVGGAAPTLAMIGLAAAGMRSAGLAWLGATIVAVFILLNFIPSTYFEFTAFVLLGFVVWGASIWNLRQLFKSGPSTSDVAMPRSSADAWFMLFWLIVELIAYFLLSPFPAVRRLTNIILVLTVVVGGGAARADLWQRRKYLLSCIVTGGVALALLFFAADTYESRLPQSAAALALEHIHSQKPSLDASVWYAGHWGFQYYAEEAGMKPIIPDHSLLRAGDWVVIPVGGMQVPGSSLNEAPVVDSLQRLPLPTHDVPFHLSTVPNYYFSHYWDCPLEYHRNPRQGFVIARMTRDFKPITQWTDKTMVDWARSRNRPVPPKAVPALLRVLKNDEHYEREVKELIAKSGVDGLTEALQDDDPEIRAWAAASLDKLRGRTAANAR